LLPNRSNSTLVESLKELRTLRITDAMVDAEYTRHIFRLVVCIQLNLLNTQLPIV